MAESKSQGSSYVFSGVLGLILTGFAGFEARDFPLQDLQEGLGAAFFPLLVIGCISVLCIAQILYGLKLGLKVESPFEHSLYLYRLGFLFLAFVGFTIAFAYFGLLAPTIVFLIIAMRILQATWVKAVIVGTCAALSVYGIFVVGFGVPMP